MSAEQNPVGTAEVQAAAEGAKLLLAVREWIEQQPEPVLASVRDLYAMALVRVDPQRAIEAAARAYDFELDFTEFDFASAAYWQRHGHMLPDDWRGNQMAGVEPPSEEAVTTHG